MTERDTRMIEEPVAERRSAILMTTSIVNSAVGGIVMMARFIDIVKFSPSTGIPISYVDSTREVPVFVGSNLPNYTSSGVAYSCINTSNKWFALAPMGGI